MTETVTAVDLFCGAGGLSTGLALACEELDRDVELVAVNHWGKAIETHSQNHPWATHLNAKVEELHPPNVVDPGAVDILVAAPECTHFSNARGGKPVDEQKRASPWHVIDWAQKVRPDNLLLENVQELESWGPVVKDGTPSRNGELFEAWIDSLHALGYNVDWDVLNAADYGDATSRERLFVIGRLDARAEFPQPTHSENGRLDGTEPWRPAAEIIDWSDSGESIWNRNRPLVQNTMRRIAEGLRRYGDDRLAPFADAIEKLEKPDVKAMQSDMVPASAVETAAAERCEPFLVKYYGRSNAYLAIPYILSQHSTGDPRSVIDDLVPTITTTSRGISLARPPLFLLRQQSGGVPVEPAEDPLPTIATKGAISKIESRPFILPRNGAYRGLHSNPAYDPTDRPLHTVTAKNHDGHLIQPYILDYEGPPDSIRWPLGTITSKDRFGLVLPEYYPWGLDIRFRMLQPRELAAAMGFPDDYEIQGNKTETVKQIGNAVPVNLAQSLCQKLLTGDDPTLKNFGAEVPEPDGPVVADGGER